MLWKVRITIKNILSISLFRPSSPPTTNGNSNANANGSGAVVAVAVTSDPASAGIGGGGDFDDFDMDEEDEEDFDGGAGGGGVAATGVADETIATILDSMDIGALGEKHNLAVKQSLFLAFLYLVVVASAVVIAVVLAVTEVSGHGNIFVPRYSTFKGHLYEQVCCFVKYLDKLQ